jgi:hypothetical protein
MINPIDPYLPAGAALNPEAPYNQSDDDAAEEDAGRIGAEQFRALFVAPTKEKRDAMLKAALNVIEESNTPAPKVKVFDLTTAADEVALAAIKVADAQAKARLSLADWFAANMEEANAKRG